MSLYNVLPPPRHSYTSISTHASNVNGNNDGKLAIAQLNDRIPRYGDRMGYIPREVQDFGDGGAFPEIHIKQYPLDMGQSDVQKTTSSVVPLKVNEKGEVQYDAILRENMRKDQILHCKHTDLIAKDDVSDAQLLKPSQEEGTQQTEDTRKALERMINAKIKSIAPTHSNMSASKPVTVRYESAHPSASSAAIQSRLIKIYDMPSDPLDPPKFRHKKLPPRPPSPPVPIMHSPPRMVTVEDQKNWKVPPCVSNWKNNKGFTLPLHQRLAADGRGLYNHVINDKFAKFSEALLIAERQARKEVEARAQMRMKLSKKQKEEKEKELAAMAKAAKDAAKYNEYRKRDETQYGINGRDGRDERDERDGRDGKDGKDGKDGRNGRKRKRQSESESESSSDSEDDERVKAYQEREEIRKERERERKRQYRLDRKKTGKNNSVRQRERDISERIALGQFSGKKSTQSLYDNRLFNQDSGLNTGFGDADDYNLYDSALFKNKSRRIYRPTVDEDMYGMDGIDVLNEKSAKIRAHKGFDGAEENRNNGKRRRFEFEKDESEQNDTMEQNQKDELEEDLERYTTVKERKNVKAHHKGYMYAAGGGGGNVDDHAQRRGKVMFEVGKDDLNDDKGRKAGLHYTDNMRKEKERRDRDRDKDKYERKDRYRRRRSRSRSRSRSHSRDRNRRCRRDRDKDRERNRSRSRDRDDSYESRGRWRGGD